MLDHLVLATPDVDRTAADLAGRHLHTVEGGSHVGAGTRNRLAGIGPGRYLEVVGPDPAQDQPASPRPFRIDTLTGPTLVTWAVRVDDLDAASMPHVPSGTTPEMPATCPGAARTAPC